MKNILITTLALISLAGCMSARDDWSRALNKVLGPESVSAEYQEKVASKIAKAAQSANPERTMLRDVVKDASNKLSNVIKDKVDGTFSNSKTEVSIVGFEKNKPRYEILNVTGFAPSRNSSIQNFIQSSIHSTSGRHTVNIGLGRRYLSENEKYLSGINAFLDYDIRYGHQRYSIGGELRSSSLELTANSYYGLSDWKTGKNNNSERALDGYDIELGAQIPYVPSGKIYVKQFNWEMYDATDVEGTDYSVAFSQLINSGVGVEAGHRDYSGSETDENFIKFHYNVAIGEEIRKTREPFVSNKMFENSSMKPQMLDKVRRNNAIVVQTKFTSSVGGV